MSGVRDSDIQKGNGPRLRRRELTWYRWLHSDLAHLEGAAVKDLCPRDHGRAVGQIDDELAIVQRVKATHGPRRFAETKVA